MVSNQLYQGLYQGLETTEETLPSTSQNDALILDDQEEILPSNVIRSTDCKVEFNYQVAVSHDIEYYSSNLASYRYYLYRYFAFPFYPTLRRIPFFGTKTWFEMLLLVYFYTVVMSSSGSSGSLGAGQAADFLGFFMIFLILRKNYMLRVYGGLSFDQGIFWHKVTGYSMFVLMLIHGLGEGSSVTGIGLAIFLSIASFSYSFTFLEGYWNYFYLIHIGCYCLCFIFSVIHGAKYFAISMFFWTIDLWYRYYIQHKSIVPEITPIGNNYLKVSFPKCFDYYSGQFLCLNVPTISQWEYHPISIASCSSETNMTLYIKQTGDWTTTLQKQATNNTNSLPKACIEGSYGILTVNCFDKSVYNMIILVSGGIGVTPNLGLFKALINQRKEESSYQKIIFVWSVREVELADYIYQHEIQPVASEFKQSLDRLEENSTNNDDNSLNKVYKKNLIDLHLHLTSCKNNNELNLLRNKLISRDVWQPNRPNLMKLFKETENICKRQGYQRIAVFVSGPENLLEETRILCDQFSSQWKKDRKAIRFDCHEESFGF